MTEGVLYPNWKEIVVYAETGMQPQVLVENEDFKSVLVGMAAGNSIPPHPEGPGVFHFLEGSARMVVGEKTFTVGPGATVIVPDGAERGIEAQEQLAFLVVRSPR